MTSFQRLAPRIAVAAGSLVPIGAGGAGVLLGPGMAGAGAIGSTDLDSHFRYLSGLLLAIGIGFVSTIPRLEASGTRFRLLTALVVMGGLARLLSLATLGPPLAPMLGGLAMELVVTPALAFWQWRLERAAVAHADGGA